MPATDRRREAAEPKLEPPDTARCQAERKVGAFALGGRIGKRSRCERAPTVILEETQPGDDGQRGSMSLCDECLAVARGYGLPPFTVKAILSTPKLRKKRKVKCG